LTTVLRGQHHVTIPNHAAVKVGTIRSILKAVAAHHEMELAEIVGRLGF
jgi:hypothetical protein